MEYLQYSYSKITLPDGTFVLNLIINGIPSIHENGKSIFEQSESFKPYYKWNTFNTRRGKNILTPVLQSFKPYYKWNTFNTSYDIKLCFLEAMF